MCYIFSILYYFIKCLFDRQLCNFLQWLRLFPIHLMFFAGTKLVSSKIWLYNWCTRETSLPIQRAVTQQFSHKRRRHVFAIKTPVTVTDISGVRRLYMTHTNTNVKGNDTYSLLLLTVNSIFAFEKEERKRERIVIYFDHDKSIIISFHSLFVNDVDS